MKVAIIGAGTIGLYLSWKLSEKGHNVFLFEKREKIGREVCSGLFSERILNFLPESQNLIENQINFCLIHFPKKTIKVDFEKKFFVMEHSKLDLLLENFAKKAGAKIILGQKIESIPNGFDRIIGCDGANSQIRKILGLKDPTFYLGIQGFILKKDNSNFVETWPTKEGFLWKIPRGNKIEWGIMERPKRAKMIFEKFLKKNKLVLKDIKSAVIPQGLILVKNEKITLCGDSMGLTKPWSGGGVIWGLTASEILLRTFPDFLKYQKELKKFFLSNFFFSKFVKKLVYFFGFKFPFFLPKKTKIDGDFLVGKFLKL